MPSVPCVISGTITWSESPELPGKPPSIWPSPGYPAHPIAPGGPPPQVMPPIYYPPSIWPDPGHPAHPIAPGGPPPQVMPPIYYPPSIWPSPGHPAHPIAPGGPPPGGGLADPDHPINKPPEQDPPPGFEWVFVFLPGVGWGWVCKPIDKADGKKP